MFHPIKLLPTLLILAVIGFAAAATTKAVPTTPFVNRTGAGGLCDPPGNPNCANNITFEEPGYPTNPTLVQSITKLGVVFSSPGSTDGMGKVEVISGSGFNVSGNVLLSVSHDGTSFDLLITLPSGTTAVGFDLSNSNNPGASFDISVNGTTPFVLATTYQSFKFFGVTDPGGIQTIRIVNPTGGTGGQPLIDNFTFGPTAAPAETPEAASMILLGTGLIGLSASIRRRRNAAKKRENDEGSQN